MDQFNAPTSPITPPSAGSNEPVSHKSLALLIIILILVVAGLVYLGNRYGRPKAPAEDTTGLTEAERAEILKSLQLPPGTPPLTPAQKDEIVKSLRLPENTPPLTEAQKAEILKSLK